MLLLLSNSRDAEGRYLFYPREAIREALGGRRGVFVPFAGVTGTWDEYAGKVRAALAEADVAVDGVHAAGDAGAMRAAIEGAEAIVVGGGNTFHLLMQLQRLEMLDVIRERVRAGVPYLGWSAGSVLAAPTIRTTNDMAIVEPPNGLGALGLVPFQINAHFTDVHPPGFQGETRRERLAEFLIANPLSTVVGLPEGDWLEVVDGVATLRGAHPAFVFRAGTDVETIEVGGIVAR